MPTKTMLTLVPLLLQFNNALYTCAACMIRRLNGNTGRTEYDIITLAELMCNYSSIRWQEYISGMLPSTVLIDENQVVIPKTPSYFDQLEELMSKTPKIVQANYIAQSIALYSIDYLGKAMRDKQQRFLAALSGVTETSPRWKICIKSASDMSFAIESAKKPLSADTKRNVASMLNDTRQALGQLLETVSWIDRITKLKALKKLNVMSAFIAYPDQFSDDKLDKIYENLDVDEDHYYENVYKLSLWNTEHKFGQLRDPIDRSDMFGERPATVTAIYSSRKNNFALTAGILQGAFFDKDRPRYINYGAIGTVIGHEMTHTFDGDRRRIDWKGDYADWFQPSSEKEYRKREQCMVDRYSNYAVQEVGLNVNGALTKNENIADNGGMKAAYIAYNNWVAKNGVEGKLPGIDMTPNQLFWMSTANLKCSKYTTDYLIDRIKMNEHSPDEFRIIGSMSHIPEFAKDFACPPGSNMNPTQRCSIW